MCELWIRSQDKTLLAKYNRVAVAQVTPKTQAQVMGFVGYDFGYETLGRYETKERALEVLDEIQMFIDGEMVETRETTQLVIPRNTNVYEMPEK